MENNRILGPKGNQILQDVFISSNRLEIQHHSLMDENLFEGWGLFPTATVFLTIIDTEEI